MNQPEHRPVRARTATLSPASLTGPRVLLAVLCAVVLAVTLLPDGSASADSSRWAKPGKARIHPGVQMYTKGAQCTANFVYGDAAGRVYVGYAAHCAGKGSATDTNGCKNRSQPLGTKVRFAEGGSLVDPGTTQGWGRLRYSSWRVMRRIGTPRNSATCQYNDLALAQVLPRFVKRVNPSVPFFGGPTGLARTGSGPGARVYSYQNSSLRGGATALKPKTGVVLERGGKGWTRTVETVSPGVPGDSGSGYLAAKGKALGTLSTIALAPAAGTNGVADLAKELRFAKRHSGIAGLHLVRGTVDFSPPAG